MQIEQFSMEGGSEAQCRANVPANVPNVLQSALNVLQRALNVRFVSKQLACAYRAVSDVVSATSITFEQRCLTNRESRPQRKVATLAQLSSLWHGIDLCAEKK